MSETKTIKVDCSTHAELKRLAAERRTTVAGEVARAVRLPRQENIGGDLARPLLRDEAEWLGADLG